MVRWTRNWAAWVPRLGEEEERKERSQHQTTRPHLSSAPALIVSLWRLSTGGEVSKVLKLKKGFLIRPLTLFVFMLVTVMVNMFWLALLLLSLLSREKVRNCLLDADADTPLYSLLLLLLLLFEFAVFAILAAREADRMEKLMKLSMLKLSPELGVHRAVASVREK